MSYRYSNGDGERSSQIMAYAIMGLIAILVIGGLIFYFGSSERVQGGHAAVVTHHGKAQKAVGPGRYFEPAWGTSFVDYETRFQDAEYVHMNPDDSDSAASHVDWSVETNSSDGVKVYLTATFRYQTPVESLVDIYNNAARNDQQVWDKIVNKEVRDVMREVATTTPIRTMYLDGRQATSDQIQTALVERLAKFGVTLESFSLKEVIPPEEYIANIQAQQNEIEAAEKKKAETETARQEATRKEVVAQGDKRVSIIEAEAVAESNNIVNESYTPEILYAMYIEAIAGSNYSIYQLGDLQPTMPIEEPEATPAP